MRPVRRRKGLGKSRRGAALEQVGVRAAEGYTTSLKEYIFADRQALGYQHARAMAGTVRRVPVTVFASPVSLAAQTAG